MKITKGELVIMISFIVALVLLLIKINIKALQAEDGKNQQTGNVVCRVVWEQDGVTFHGEWNSDCDLVKGWVEDGNERFPQFKYRVEKKVTESDCIERLFQGKDMQDCFPEK